MEDVPEKPEKENRKVEALEREISSAYCSMAELYTSDLCDEENAESECERLLLLAFQTSSSNIDALQALANFRLIQNKNDEALKYLKLCFNVLNETPVLHDDETDLSGSFEVRSNVAKIALELKQDEEALELIESLLQENDSNPETWWLAGNAYQRTGDVDNAREYLSKAKQMLDAKGVDHSDNFYVNVTQSLSSLSLSASSSSASASTSMSVEGGHKSNINDDDIIMN